MSPVDPPLFAIAGRTVTLASVIEAAEVRGALAEHRRRFQASRARERACEAAGEAADPDGVEAVADALRYERGLITATETEAWLTAHDLTVEDLDAHCRTEHLGAAGSAADVSEGNTEGPFPSEEERRFRARLVLSGVAAAEARALACLLAYREEIAGREAPPPLHDLRALERAYEGRRAVALTERARTRMRHAMRLALIRVDVETLALASVDAAREAVLCVREDGAALPALAAETRRPYEKRSIYLGDEAGERCDALLSTPIGGMFLWTEDDDGVTLWRVVGKHEPDPSDPEVARRVDEAVLDAFDEECLARRVCWLVPEPRET